MWSHHHLLVVMEGPIHNRPPDQAGRDAIHAYPLLCKLLWSTTPTGVTNATQHEKTLGRSPMSNELAHPSENKRVQRTAPEREKALANGRVLSATHEQPGENRGSQGRVSAHRRRVVCQALERGLGHLVRDVWPADEVAGAEDGGGGDD